MIFRQYQTACLSLFSYLIGDESTRRAVVVDPQRDISCYLADADALGLHIERVIETHFHADFLSGHLELAAATGATVSYGDGARAEFPIDLLRDGQRLSLGQVILEVLATPGHTPESISVVAYEHDGAPPWAVLTGDTLFIGDVGRPDLLSSQGWTSEQLARRLYRSIHEKLLGLPDATRVYPAHGAGSACGKSMSTASESTVGEQRRSNYALRPMTEDEFVAVVTEGQPVAPMYFAFAAAANHRRRDLLDERLAPLLLDHPSLRKWWHEGAVLIDSRGPEAFASGHIRGSVNVPLEGRFAEYAGDVVRPNEPIVVITEPGRETEAKVRLARIGFDRVEGAVIDVDRLLRDHPELASTATRVPASEVARWRADWPQLQLVDVRNPAEQHAGMIADATSAPLATLLDRLGDLDPDRPTLIYCASGVRSSIAASVLRARGFVTVADVLGGYNAWETMASTAT